MKRLSDDTQMSERWVREQLALGMPHLKFGSRVMIDPNEARDWLREKYRRTRGG